MLMTEPADRARGRTARAAALVVVALTLLSGCVAPPEGPYGYPYGRYRIDADYSQSYSYWSIETAGDGTSPEVRLRVDGIGFLATDICVQWSFPPSPGPNQMCRPVVTFPGSSQTVRFADPRILGSDRVQQSAMAVYVKTPPDQTGATLFVLAVVLNPVSTTGFTIRNPCISDCG